MTLKVIITGATGMIGKGVLLECIDDENVTEILVIGRNSSGIKHAKVTEILHSNFDDYTPIQDRLIGYDACFYCLGISAAGLSEKQYTTITYTYTLALARALIELNPALTFIYVSGQGTDSSEKGRLMWARVKGKTENDLIVLGFSNACMFRPGIIIPLRGITSRTKSYQFFYDYFMWLVKVIRWISPKSVVNTTQLGKAMINAARVGYDSKILGPHDIQRLSASNRN